MAKIEESLQCPVCYKIPRKLPIPCCGAGHIVCQPCRSRVTHCPTCRGKMKSNTNTVVGDLIMLVFHKCKFSSLGCDVKMKLEDIAEHEKDCPERTARCPEAECKEEFQFKNFDQHVLSKHSLKCFFKNGAKYVVSKEDIEENSMLIATKLGGFSAHNFVFNLIVDYDSTEQSLVLFMVLPQDVEIASKFTAKMTITHPDSPRTKLTYECPVLSTEEASGIYRIEENMYKYWIISYKVMRSFYGEMDKLPIQVEVFKETEVKRKRKRN